MKKQEEQWQAVLRRDRTRDGKFVYGVVTTGVFCRPSCAARRPRRENVRFFASPAQARAAGMRPCRRCWSGGVDAKVHALCRWLAGQSEAPTLAAMAKQTSLSPWHLHRSFRAVMGVTPRQFAAGLRVAALKRHLRAGAGVTEAVYAAGYGSASAVYAGQLGMRPRTYRRGGEGMQIAAVSVATDLGWLIAGMTATGVCAVRLGASRATVEVELRREFPRARLSTKLSSRQQTWLAEIRQLANGASAAARVPLDLRGTQFQTQVWEALRGIPRGETRRYGEIAAGLGRARAARAVARACGSNPAAMLVPCHRVVPASGGVGGYRWGGKRKQTLLQREAAV